jgi:predicted ATPase/DNA-binding CsgD family transcriptional regulator
MHYAFDSWLGREFPAVEFERSADDVVVHCATERQASQVLEALGERMTEVGLALHPEKTKIVYYKDRKRRLDHEHTSFTFLGYTFRARKAPTRDGKSMLTAFLPAVSRDAFKKMGSEVRRWPIYVRQLAHRRLVAAAAIGRPGRAGCGWHPVPPGLRPGAPGRESGVLDLRRVGLLHCCWQPASLRTSQVARSQSMRGARGWPAGLPAPLTVFVGRERELAEIGRLVAAHRLVTLVGAGGVGKARTAIEVAAGVRAIFGDGVNLVDLSAVPDPALLPGAVARALGVEDRAGSDLEQRLVRVLRPQRRLVVLDNCEYLRRACAALAAGLLAACPRVTVLATSRESLAVPGEVTWRVPSLAFPWPEHQPALAELEGFEAAALFLARARAACPGLVIGAGDVAAVTSICFRLDGIPLALELAAALAGALSLDDIAKRLTGRFELLAGSGTGPARHQTLRASVEWSCQLLGQDERALFRRVAIFSGGWSLDAAEAICTGGPVAPQDAARLMAALAGKSLVHVDQSGSATRYRLLETIRAFAHEQLAKSGELEQVRARHGEYFAGLGERSAPMLLGPGQARWARRLDQETENLRAAGQWCSEDPARAGLGLRLASGLWEYWHIRGRLEEGARWLEDALGMATAPAGARAAALNGLGVIVSLRGEHERGCELFTQSIECYQQIGDVRGQARAWTHLGNARTIQGDPAGAAEAFDRGLALARRSGDAWYEAFALYLSGWAATVSGDIGWGKSRVAESSGLFARIGDHRGVGYALVILGDCMLRDGQPAGAVPVLREGISIFEALPERWGLLCGASLLAAACAALGDWPQVATLLGVIDTLRERTGSQLLPPMQAAIGALAEAAGNELGHAVASRRQAGRAIGRGDQITAALWPGPDDTAEPAAGPSPPLTTREREVAGLIAQGLTNRQIGGRLFIAERTVDTHVGRILAKLGCSSRAQVAVIVATGASFPAQRQQA